MATSPWLHRRQPLDRGLAALLAVSSLPVLAALALAVRVVDGRPAFVQLERAGKAFAPLTIRKLRTMRVAAHDGSAGGAPLTLGNDPRVTPLGARLRRWRLDELPQLIQIVRGEMSLIGPRPEAPDYVDAGDERWQQILAVAPGLAGATQVLVQDWESAVLEGTTSDAVYRQRVLPAKVALDHWYVTNASARVDLWIVISLVQRFLLGARVTTLHRRVDLDALIGPEAAADLRAAC